MNENIKTKLGTPCAPAWPTEWIHQVEMAEAELKHRICGAIGPDGAPCPMPSEHHSGRCKYHGGSPLTGAQPGNKNATKHGLYSRRLRICGPHCPKRHTCPRYDERLLEFPKTKWPTCPYEQEEYDNLIQALLPEGQDHSPLYEHMVHTTALLSVMTSRAAAVLSMHTLVAVTHVQFHDYSMESHKVSALLQAFLRLTSEHTKSVRELAKLSIQAEPQEGHAKPKKRGSCLLPSPVKVDEQREGACPHAPHLSTRPARGYARPPTENRKEPPEPNDNPDDQENHREQEEQKEKRAPANPNPPEKLKCTFSTTATKIKKNKTNKKRRKKKRNKAKQKRD